MVDKDFTGGGFSLELRQRSPIFGSLEVDDQSRPLSTIALWPGNSNPGNANNR